MRVQNLYSDGLLGVDDAIAEAEKVATKSEKSVNDVKKFDKER